MLKALVALLTLASVAFAQDVPAKDSATAPTDATVILTELLYTGRASEAPGKLASYVGENPNDQAGHFALGTARFIRAVEKLGQSLYRYGLISPGEDVAAVAGPHLPFLRFPVPTNPKPESLTFDKFRGVLTAFVDDLATIDEPLSKVDDGLVGLRLKVGLVRFDLDGNGIPAPEESLWRLLARVSEQQISEASAESFVVRFDSADAAWLRGYAHLLQATANVLLAYDWRDSFDHLFHTFFPRSSLPYAQLDDLMNSQRPLWEDYLKCANRRYDWECYQVRRPTGVVNPFWARLADSVAFFQLAQWNVIEPDRMAQARVHLVKMIAMSRLSWARILEEMDNDNEWIPNPKQSGMLPGMFVNARVVKDWLVLLDKFESLLEGKTLLAHWRFAKGINLKRVFLEPRQLNPALWFQGSSALPYLEDGSLVDASAWTGMTELLRSNFMAYATWFN